MKSTLIGGTHDGINIEVDDNHTDPLQLTPMKEAPTAEDMEAGAQQPVKFETYYPHKFIVSGKKYTFHLIEDMDPTSPNTLREISAQFAQS